MRTVYLKDGSSEVIFDDDVGAFLRRVIGERLGSDMESLLSEAIERRETSEALFNAVEDTLRDFDSLKELMPSTYEDRHEMERFCISAHTVITARAYTLRITLRDAMSCCE